MDASGRVLVRNKALLSLKDLNLSERLDDLISAGVTSFKIEGRLKNASFVRNTVREYSRRLDGIVGRSGGALRRASFGSVGGGFEPDLSKTFNRGYTELFLDGKRGKWASLDAPKSMGELIGTVRTVRPAAQGMEIVLSGTANLRNGDGFAFVHDGEIVGFRGDICQGNKIVCKPVRGLRPGMELWRNISVEFEKALEANPCRRFVGVTLEVCASSSSLTVSATSEDGRVASVSLEGCEPARDMDRASSLISGQLSKRTDHYAFSVSSLDSEGGIPHLSAAVLNGLRRELASQLDAQPVHAIPMATASGQPVIAPEALSTGRRPGELMRSKYCIRYELGICPIHQKDAERPAALQGVRPSDKLFLVNNGRRFPLLFDCARCEMAVMAL